MSRRLLILAWHNVDETWCFPEPMRRGPRNLLEQLRWLRRCANVVDLEEALFALAGERPLPRRAVALTFDDGYRDSVSIVAPMLRELGLPATFFLAPGILSREITPWWEAMGFAFSRTARRSLPWDDRSLDLEGPARQTAFALVAARFKALDVASRDHLAAEVVDLLEVGTLSGVHDLFLDWDGARRLVHQGMAIGSHTVDHAILSFEAPDAQLRNLGLARQRLEEALGVPARLLAYPNGGPGDFDVTTERLASEVGHCGAVTTIPGWNTPSTCPFQLHRFVVDPHRGALRIAGTAGRAVTGLHAR